MSLCALRNSKGMWRCVSSSPTTARDTASTVKKATRAKRVTNSLSMISLASSSAFSRLVILRPCLPSGLYSPCCLDRRVFWEIRLAASEILGNSEASMKRAKVFGPGPCHNITPWTHYNRVLLCQATLSIGPYLLLSRYSPNTFLFPEHLRLKTCREGGAGAQ